MEPPDAICPTGGGILLEKTGGTFMPKRPNLSDFALPGEIL